MKIEITEIELEQILYGTTEYRYDCFIDNVYIASTVWDLPKEPFRVYEYFLKLLIREWTTKYQKIYIKGIGENHHCVHEGFNPKTIVCEEIQNLDLTLKRANEFIRLQKMEGDFN